MQQCRENPKGAFGVVLDCKLGGVIATANTGAHLDVTLHWRGPGRRRDDA
jgi:hypothetical protein